MSDDTARCIQHAARYGWDWRLVNRFDQVELQISERLAPRGRPEGWIKFRIMFTRPKDSEDYEFIRGEHWVTAKKCHRTRTVDTTVKRLEKFIPF